MKLTIDIPSIRVVETNDYKGNPVTVLTIFDTPVLYTRGHGPEGLDPEIWEDLFKRRLANHFADLFLDNGINHENGAVWEKKSPTGREVWTDSLTEVRE